MQQSISNPEFYGDLVYRLRKSLEIQTSQIFQTYCKPFQESRIYFRHYAVECMPSFNPIMVEGYAALFSCTAVVQASDSMMLRCEALNSWLKLDNCLWLDPPWFN